MLGENGEKVLEVPPTGKVARVVESMEKAENINGVPTVHKYHGPGQYYRIKPDGVIPHPCQNCSAADQCICGSCILKGKNNTNCEVARYCDRDVYIECAYQVPRRFYIVTEEVYRQLLNPFGDETRNDVVYPYPEQAYIDDQGNMVVRALVVPWISRPRQIPEKLKKAAEKADMDEDFEECDGEATKLEGLGVLFG